MAQTQHLSSPPPSPDERPRLNLSLSEEVDRLLAHVANTTGTTKTAIAMQLIAQGLPGLLEQTQTLRKAARDLAQTKGR